MKKTFFILSVLFFAVQSTYGQALTIIDQDFNAAQKEAVKQQKLLLIDFYTTWCVPCKHLDKAVFGNKTYSDMIAKNFVVLKYDAERDTVFNLSLKFHIGSYPTAVVLNNEHRTIAKKYGFSRGDEASSVKDYMRFLEDAVQQNQQGKYISGISTDFKLAYPDFYRLYVYRLKNIKENDVPDYWKTNTNYLNEVSFCVLSYFGGTAEVNKYFLNHKEQYKALYGEADIKNVTYRIVATAFDDAIKAKDNAQFEKARHFCETNIAVPESKEIIDVYELELWQATDNWEKVAGHIEKNKDELIKTGTMNNYCWKIFEKSNDKVVLKKAVGWMKELCAASPSYAVLDTYARLLHKSGDRQGAIDEMKKGIALGKANGEDTKEGELTLSAFER